MPHYHRLHFHIGPSTLEAPRPLDTVTRDLIHTLGTYGSVVVMNGETFPDVSLSRTHRRRPSPLFGLLRKHDRSSIIRPFTHHLPADVRDRFDKHHDMLVYDDATDTYTYAVTWRTNRPVDLDNVRHRLRHLIKETAKRNGRVLTVSIAETFDFPSASAPYRIREAAENAHNAQA